MYNRAWHVKDVRYIKKLTLTNFALVTLRYLTRFWKCVQKEPKDVTGWTGSWLEGSGEYDREERGQGGIRPWLE